jgi:hypothetical protein
MKTQAAIVVIVLAFLVGCATTPGQRNSNWPNVITSADGNWTPAPGYNWVYPNNQNNLAVRWEPARAYRHPTRSNPNVIASNDEGQWIPAPGFTWAETDSAGRPFPGKFAVRWKPGTTYFHPTNPNPNVIAANSEGNWYPAPGYKWSNTDSNGNPVPGSLAVHWVPGSGFWYLGAIKWPNLVAGTTEGEWYPESGYEWARLDSNGRPRPGDLAVVSSAERAAIQQRESIGQRRKDAMNEHWEKYLKEIQAQNAYPNWSGPPYDLFVKKRR